MARPRNPDLTDGVALSLRLPKDLHEAAVDRARREDRNLNQLIRFALRRYLAEDEA